MRPASLIFFSFSQKQIHLNSTWRSLSDHRFYCCNFFTYIFVLQRLSSLFTCYFYYPDYEILIFCTYNYLCKSTAFFFYLLCETPDLILPQQPIFLFKSILQALEKVRISSPTLDTSALRNCTSLFFSIKGL